MDQFNQAPAPTQEEFDALNDSIATKAEIFSLSVSAQVPANGLFDTTITGHNVVGVDLTGYCWLAYKIYNRNYLLIVDPATLTIVKSQPTITATVYYI